MTTDYHQFAPASTGAGQFDDDQLIEPVPFDFAVPRRSFVQALGAGLLITVTNPPALAQRRRRRRGGPRPSIAARVHLANDGTITVMTGKTEMGQGARGELAQAAAEELRVAAQRVTLLMADTAAVPNDGITAGSRTTPSTVPAVRQGTAAARELLIEFACRKWNVEPSDVTVRDGSVLHSDKQPSLGYAELAAEMGNDEQLRDQFEQPIPDDVSLTPVAEWQVMGTSYATPNRRDLVTGSHQFPTDISRPGMLYGRVLRPPTYGAKLLSIDVEPAKAVADVVVVRDGEFVGVAAPNSFLAGKAIDAIAETAQWESKPHPSSEELYGYLREHADGGVPANPFRAELEQAAHTLKQSYRVAYVQHAPLEPRVALAEWSDDKLTVWTGTQNPFGFQRELGRAFGLQDDAVRVVVPDFGSGFGGKHTGEAAVEAARLARGAGRPVLLRWNREEEFTWAYFRPAGVIDIEAGLDSRNRLTSWHCVNINSGRSSVETPYHVRRSDCRSVRSAGPLREGSYRALAATANTFARESFMDELAAAAGMDPLEFRLAHLENRRLRRVLQEAARRFDWQQRLQDKQDGHGVGLACGTEKGSYVAACVEIEIDRRKQIQVRHVCQAFECGAVINPDNLRSQVEGAIVMGLGPALEEEMRFEGGTMQNATFRRYRVPRFADVPSIDVHLVNRSDLPSVGGGETPLIAVAPAIANAVYHASGQRVRQMPIKL